MGKPYKSAVIGLGRVGSSYPTTNMPRTHAGVYKVNSGTSLVSGVDRDALARMAFSERWGNDIPVYSSVSEMLLKVQPDIISVCAHPLDLQEIVEECMQSPPRLFFLEKPVFSNPDNAHQLSLKINSVPSAINYQRCWDPAHSRFFEQINASGTTLAVRVIYNNGLFNYASHLIALLIRYFGSVLRVTKLGNEIFDVSAKDSSPSFVLEFEPGFEAVFQGLDSLPYDMLELEVVTTSGVYALKSTGCRRRIDTPAEGAFYPNYTHLIEAPYSEPDAQVEGMTQAVDNIVNFLDGKTTELSCDLNLGLNVFDVLWKVKTL